MNRIELIQKLRKILDTIDDAHDYQCEIIQYSYSEIAGCDCEMREAKTWLEDIIKDLQKEQREYEIGYELNRRS